MQTQALTRVAWWMIGLGMLGGAVLGCWSFGGPIAPPAGFSHYDDAPRRLLRLAHIALIALPILALELGRTLPQTRLGEVATRRVQHALLFGLIALPTLLTAAAVLPWALYLLPLPVCALMGSAFTVALGLGRAAQTEAP